MEDTRPTKKKDPLENHVQKLLDHQLLDHQLGPMVIDTTSMLSHAYEGGDEPCDSDILRELRKVTISLADSQKGLSEYEKEYGMSWRQSICYPVPPESIAKKPHLRRKWNLKLGMVEGPLLSGMKCADDAHSSDITRKDVVHLGDGRIWKVASLLSLGGDQTLVARNGGEGIVLNTNTLIGKYVLVCCINAPVLFGSNGFQSLLNLCNELSLERDDVEVVMVARLNILADTKKDFNHLLSGFPTSCLAVPYEAWERRERIWKLLECDAYRIRCVVYDTNGLFLTSFHVNDYSTPYGAEAFPFTEEVVKKIGAERIQLRKDKLEKLLKPHEFSGDVCVYELNPKDGPQKEQQLSEVIKDKHVGLYLCCQGSLIPRLRKLYKQCKQKKEEFEIVVLYLPVTSNIDPRIFKEKIERVLRKKNIRGWWCLPFNNSVSLRFCGLTMDYSCGLHYDCRADQEDKLIIVGTEGKILDMYGGQIIHRRGGIDTYPFTRDAVVKKKMVEVKNLRLESLLVGELFRGDDRSDVISANMLLSNKKKVIILMGKPNEYIVNGFRYNFEGLVSQYKQMKHNQFEVVFIEYPEDEGAAHAHQFSAMPWYIHCPLDGTHTSLAKKLTELFWVQSLVGFGEDGQICSVKLLQDLKYSQRLCLDDNLYQDIYQVFQFHQYGDI